MEDNTVSFDYTLYFVIRGGQRSTSDTDVYIAIVQDDVLMWHN